MASRRMVRGVVVSAIMAAALWSQWAFAAPDYRSMAERIDAYLTKAVELYRSGDADGAKIHVQKAYFEVFENLEGPIRINISAKRNIELESEFGALRKLAMQGIPADQFEARAKAQIAAIHGVIPIIEGGKRLTAEATVGAGQPPSQPTAGPAPAHPHWIAVVDGIGRTIADAATALEAGDAEKARQMITKAQFDGYKNSLLETAVRRHVSARQDGEFNGEFQRILGLVRDGKPARMVRASGVVLVDELKAALPGLPLMGPAKETAAAEVPPASGTDWRKVADDVMAAMRGAVGIHAGGNPQRAVGSIQDAYFDVFEASGMEAQIAARDNAFKTQLEGHFNRIMGRMQGGGAAADLEADLRAMAADLDKAVAMLGEAGESLPALFVYALMIILREGFEAILIVTAIVAYLTKTGNGDKLKVIGSSVGVALLASVATAVLVKWVFDVSAASQEVLEGVTMLIATVILFSMSYWIVSKAEAERWMTFIKDKVGKSVTTGSLRALWFTSFLAVYREGAEVVLFYQALAGSAKGTGTAVIFGGFAVGCLLLAVIYAVMRLGAMKLPIRPFFMVTGFLLYYMAFVFAGKGVMELVEGKVLEPTLVSWMPEIPFLGVFPYWQTLMPQMALVVAAMIALAILLRQRAAPAAVRGR